MAPSFCCRDGIQRESETPLSSEIHRADWTIPYPNPMDETRVPAVLQALTHVEHEWDAFPWYLAQRLVGLLEAPEPCFEYFHVTAFFLARAAMLALSGGVLHRTDLFGALCRYRVQAGGIYRTHLLHYLRLFLSRQNFAQLPVCAAETFETLHTEVEAERNRGLVQRVVRFAEADYLKTLNFVSLATDMEEKVCGQTVAFWVSGGRMPAPVGVRVHTRRHEYGHDWMPTRDEAKAAYRADRPVRTIAVRPQREFGFARERDEGGTLKPESEGRSRMSAVSGDKAAAGGNAPSTELRTGWRIVGDYMVIIPPGVRKEINLANKPKARAVLRLIHTRLRGSGKKEFYAEEIRDAFNAQFAGDVAHRRWMSDRIREDLFRRKEREFDLMFELLDKAAGHYRLKICGWLGILGLGACGDWGIGEAAQWVVGDLVWSALGVA